MKHRTSVSTALRRGGFALALGALLWGCPPGSMPSRDGGRACARTAECNAGGATCGVVFECVVGFCADTAIVRACPDGSYPGGDASTGECLVSEDCNAPNACGAIVACVNYACDREGPRIMIPCEEAGAVTDAATVVDARGRD
jgi:hypothetical protein